jgi:hypothetical protein
MPKHLEKESWKKREKIQRLFWSRVGSNEHISLPMLEDAVRKGFKCEDGRFVQEQIRLMQIEARIRLESRVKVWIKPSRNTLEKAV